MMTHKNRPPTALGLGKRDYWRFLRLVYGMGALEAWDYIKQVGLPPSVDDIRTAMSEARKRREPA